MRIDPFGQRLIVKRISEQERSGLFIPKGAQLIRGSLVGSVVACGPDVEWVNIGDTILFAKYSGDPVPCDGKFIDNSFEDCLIMNEDNILGRINAAPTEVITHAGENGSRDRD